MNPIPNIIDTHSHVQFNAFKEDADMVIQKTLAEHIWMINVGTKYETSHNAVLMAQKYEQGVFAAIGLHPIYAAAEFVKTKTDPDEGEFLIKEQEFDYDAYKKLALEGGKKVVAIGEVGLDYYYKPKTTAKLTQFKEKQKQVFMQQLDLAKELNLPLILHCRMAHQDLLEILKSQITNPTDGRGGEAGLARVSKSQINPNSQNPKLRGVIHCFTGSVEEMKQYVSLGFCIGINGIIFKLPLDEVVKNCPLESMVVETDCPYLTPLPEAPKRNEPIFIKHTIQKIADLKGVSFDQVAQKTTQNAKVLFGLDKLSL